MSKHKSGRRAGIPGMRRPATCKFPLPIERPVPFVLKPGQKTVDYWQKPEYAKGNVDARYRPWRVTLFVIMSLLDRDPQPKVFYARGPNPVAAAALARRCFYVWFKHEKGLDNEKLPHCPDNFRHACNGVSEPDFAKAWSLEQRLPDTKMYGRPENPLTFTSHEEGDDTKLLIIPTQDTEATDDAKYRQQP